MFDVENYYFTFEDGIVKPSTFEGWLAWEAAEPDFEKKRRVAKTIIGDSEVSTVFLCFNHAFGREKKPILFETLVFGGMLAGEMDRYETLEDAMRGHERMVAAVQSGKRPDNQTEN